MKNRIESNRIGEVRARGRGWAAIVACFLAASVLMLGCAPREGEVAARAPAHIRYSSQIDTNPLHDAQLLIDVDTACTATLISSRILLTAAHCVVRANQRPQTGFSWIATQPDTGPIMFPIPRAAGLARCVIHLSAFPGVTGCFTQSSTYDLAQANPSHDLALLLLDRRVAPDLAEGLSRTQRLAALAVPPMRPFFRNRDNGPFVLGDWEDETLRVAAYGIRMFPVPTMAMPDHQRLSEDGEVDVSSTHDGVFDVDFFNDTPPPGLSEGNSATFGDSGGGALWHCNQPGGCRVVGVISTGSTASDGYARVSPLGLASNRTFVMGQADPAGRFAASATDFDYLYGDRDRDSNPLDDTDNDGLTTNGNGRDNCPNYPNPNQLDADNDNVGDACECPADVGGISIESFMLRADGDFDGVPDVCDNCPTVRNRDQTNADGDTAGDACDRCPNSGPTLIATDSDGDGWPNQCDLCPNVGVAEGDVAWPSPQPNCNAAMESVLGQTTPGVNKLGDACDPHPCTTLFSTSTQGTENNAARGFLSNPTCTPDYVGVGPYECSGGTSEWNLGFAPRVGTAPSGYSGPPVPTTATLTTGTWRCACLRFTSEVPNGEVVSRTECMTNAASPCRYAEIPTGNDAGFGWLPAILALPSFGPYGTFPYPSGAQRGAPPGVSAYGTIDAPNFTYATRSSLGAAFDAWRGTTEGMYAWPWPGWDDNWGRNPWPLNTVIDSPTAPPASPNHVALATRAQWPTAPLPGTEEEIAEDLQTHFLSRAQDIIPPWSRPRQVIPFHPEWWQLDTFWRIPPDPPPPFGDRERAEVISREVLAVQLVNARSPSAADAQAWSNGDAAQPVRGIVLSTLALRTVNFSKMIATEAASPSDLPMWSGAAYAVSVAEDATGWPRVYAFGGRDKNALPQRALYVAKPVAQPNGLPKLVWQRLSFESGPAARDRAAIAVNRSHSHVYVVGGRDAAGLPLDDVWSYELASGQWREITHLPARFDAGVAVRGDELFVGGGIGTGGAALGDLYQIDGATGQRFSYGFALPTGGAPYLGFDEHGDGLVYGGGYVGSTWYRDLWHVTLFEDAASTSFVADFSQSGMPATEHFTLLPDMHHGYYWALPGYNGSSSVLGVWLHARGVVEQIKPGTSSSGIGLRASSGGSGTSSAETSDATLQRILSTRRVGGTVATRVRTTRSPSRLPPLSRVTTPDVVSVGRTRVVR